MRKIRNMEKGKMRGSALLTFVLLSCLLFCAAPTQSYAGKKSNLSVSYVASPWRGRRKPYVVKVHDYTVKSNAKGLWVRKNKKGKKYKCIYKYSEGRARPFTTNGKEIIFTEKEIVYSVSMNGKKLKKIAEIKNCYAVRYRYKNNLFYQKETSDHRYSVWVYNLKTKKKKRLKKCEYFCNANKKYIFVSQGKSYWDPHEFYVVNVRTLKRKTISKKAYDWKSIGKKIYYIQSKKVKGKTYFRMQKCDYSGKHKKILSKWIRGDAVEGFTRNTLTYYIGVKGGRFKTYIYNLKTGKTIEENYFGSE